MFPPLSTGTATARRLVRRHPVLEADTLIFPELSMKTNLTIEIWKARLALWRALWNRELYTVGAFLRSLR